MPVSVPLRPDFAKEIEQDQDNEIQNEDRYSDETEAYSEAYSKVDENARNKPMDLSESPKGQLITRKHGLKRQNIKQRKYTCVICGTEQRSAQKIKKHHRESQKPLNCDICSKECNTPFSLDTAIMRNLTSVRPVTKAFNSQVNWQTTESNTE